MKKILIAYATTDGQTEIICEKIKTILENGGFLENVLFTKAFKAKNLEFINQIDSDMLFDVSEKEMKDLSNMTTPSGILAISKFPIYEKLNSSNNIVFLDQISDPGNMGTILRTASWFGIEQIVLSDKNNICKFKKNGHAKMTNTSVA